MKPKKMVYICKKCGIISDKKLIYHTWIGKENSSICNGKMIKKKLSDIFPWLRS